MEFFVYFTDLYEFLKSEILKFNFKFLYAKFPQDIREQTTLLRRLFFWFHKSYTTLSHMNNPPRSQNGSKRHVRLSYETKKASAEECVNWRRQRSRRRYKR